MKKSVQENAYILHGWVYDTKKWKPFVHSLEVSGFSVTMLKIPGLTSNLEKIWTVEDYVEWLDSKLKGQTSVYLIGHSFGGHIASRFAIEHPRKVSKLVLIDSSGIRDRSFKKILKRSIFFVLAKLGNFLFPSEKTRGFLYKLAREKDYLTASPQLRKTMQNVISDDVKSDLVKIKCPTLIVWGEKDSVTPVRFARQFQEKIRSSRLHIVKGSKHSPQFTHTKETVQKVASFLK